MKDGAWGDGSSPELTFDGRVHQANEISACQKPNLFIQRKLSSQLLDNRTSFLVAFFRRSSVLTFDQRNHTELHEGMALATSHSFHIDQEL